MHTYKGSSTSINQNNKHKPDTHLPVVIGEHTQRIVLYATRKMVRSLALLLHTANGCSLPQAVRAALPQGKVGKVQPVITNLVVVISSLQYPTIHTIN